MLNSRLLKTSRLYLTAFFVILLLGLSTQAQKPGDVKDWKLIKEMSGEIPDYPGLKIETSAAQIARNGDLVKLVLRYEFPYGTPRGLFKSAVPHGFDPSSISQIVAKVEFNCATLTVKAQANSSEIYQFNGKKHKSKEPPFTIPSGHIFAEYFCERGTVSTKAPTLKPQP